MIDSFDALDLNNPYPFFKSARKKFPIFWDERSKYWVITKYDHVKMVLSDELTYSAESERVSYSAFSQEALKVLEPINFVELFGLSTTENPQHDKVKKIIMPIFIDFVNKLGPTIESVVIDDVQSLNTKNSVDILKDLFYELPAKIIFNILGIPEEDIQEIKKWSESRLFLTWGDKEEQVYHANNILKYWNYCEHLLRSKLVHPKNDLPSKLLEYYKREEISFHEIQLLCYGLIFSGHTTTTVFLAESLKILLQTDQWKQILDNKIPFANTVDELLRLCPSAFTRRRKALKNIHIDGFFIPKDAVLLLVIGSANRDEEVFENPDNLLWNRFNANRHLTFGNGFHYCIGSKLVKNEYICVMNVLAQHYPNLKLSQINKYDYKKNISIRALNELWVNLES